MKTPFEKIEFIGWDGEGINEGFIDEWTERQKYVLISTSKNHYLYDEKGIEQERLLEFITNVAKQFPSHQYKHVFFGGSYDFNKILEGMPFEKLDELHTTKYWVEWLGHLFRYRPRKELTIARLKKGYSYNPKRKAREQSDCYIRFWDVIGFFQDSFLNVVKKWLGESYEDYELIASGKLARLNFQGDSKDLMIEYNKAETKALASIMKKLHAQLLKLDLKVARWDGAGAVAGQIFRRYQLTDSYFELDDKTKKRKTKILLDEKINEACQYAYFGGRIESGFMGRYKGEVFNYDINSAYPYAASFLPNLNYGEWIHHSRLEEREIESLDDLSLFRIQWYFHEERIYYPFPFRTLNGAVIFPKIGERWIMKPEVLSAIRSLRKHDKLFVFEAYEFKRNSFDAPFQVIESLYNERLKLLQQKDAAEYPLKLGLNSIYGKLCQKLGWNEKTKEPPSFHFLLFAAFITSFVRAKIYDVVQLAQNDVIAINTDGIVSKAPLNIRHSDKKEFGGWTLDISDEIIQLQSGVYWIRKENEWKERARGLGRVVGNGVTELERKISRNQKIEERINEILNGWDKGLSHIHFPVKLFITSKKSMISQDWFKRWGHWYIMHDSKTNEKGRGVELQCQGWGKRRLRDKLSSKSLVATQAAENIEWNGKLGSNDPSKRDLGEAYNLPWIEPAEYQQEFSDDDYEVSDI